jgi:hypothetical protein
LRTKEGTVSEQSVVLENEGAQRRGGLDMHLVGVAREQYRSLMKVHQETTTMLTQAALPMTEASDWLEYARKETKAYLEEAYGQEVARAAVGQEAEAVAEQLARQARNSALLLDRMLQSTESSLRNRLQGQDLRAWTEKAQTAGKESLDSICRSAVARLRSAV